MSITTIALASVISLNTVVDTLRGCLSALVVRDCLGILGSIWLLAVAADTRVAQGTLKAQSVRLERGG